MKMTLLEIVQKVLNSISGDEVSSITDTTEAMQVANIVEDVYFNLVTNNTIPEHNELLQIDALGDGTKPNYLRLPTAVSKISSFRYNVATETYIDTFNPPFTDVKQKSEYKDVKYVSPEDFINRIVGRNQADANIIAVDDFSGVRLLIQNDKSPQFWTSFDDEYMIFDSYNTNEDTTLQASKSMAFGVKLPVFTLSDSFVPDIDANLFPLLLNESKSWAAIELKQQGNQKAEQAARRQRVTYQNDRDRFKLNEAYVDYGRK